MTCGSVHYRPFTLKPPGTECKKNIILRMGNNALEKMICLRDSPWEGYGGGGGGREQLSTFWPGV